MVEKICISKHLEKERQSDMEEKMIIAPKVKGFMCTTAHPAGCEAAVKQQIEYVKGMPKTEGPKKVLVIGASMGYGLASRIVASYSCGADTMGIIFDKPAKGKRTASAGWYNTAAFEKLATADGYYAKTLNGDAYSQEMKDETIALIKKDWGKVDMVVYSIAAPRRTAPDGVTYRSVLKTTDKPYTNKTIDLLTKEMTEATIEAATEEEIFETEKVMGGEDWKLWIEALDAAGVLAENAVTVAYSYIGPELTYPIYYEGSIGRAKQHLYRTGEQLRKEYPNYSSYVSVNKAVVTQSSAAIPVVPLYISLLYKIMKEKGKHEGCIEQMYRMFHDRLYAETVETDEEMRIRVDDYEMDEEIQNAVKKAWDEVSKENIDELADLEGYWQEFYEIFGFQVDAVAYDEPVNANVEIPSLQAE